MTAVVILVMFALPGLKAQYEGEVNFNPAELDLEQT